jgi:hypothetical protein
MGSILHAWHGWFFALFLFCGALVFSTTMHWLLFRILRRQQAEKSSQTLGWGLHKHLGGSARAIFVITCLFLVLPLAPGELKPYLGEPVHHVLAIAMVLSLSWFAIGTVYIGEGAFLRRYDITAEDNIRARQIQTQLLIFRRTLIGFIFVITAGGHALDLPR